MSNETMPKYVFSRWGDGDNWYYEIKDALDGMDTAGGGVVTLYRGETRDFAHEDFIDVDEIIEEMGERAYDEIQENAENYLSDIPEEKRTELHRVIAEWFDANVPKPRFYAVDNVVLIEVQLDAGGNYVSHRVVDTPTEA